MLNTSDRTVRPPLAPEQKMFRDWIELTLFRAETLPEMVPVLSLLNTVYKL